MDLRDWQGKYLIVYGTRTQVIFAVIAMINQYQRVDFVCMEESGYEGLLLLNRKVISFEEAKRIQSDSLFIVSPDNYTQFDSMFDHVFTFEQFGEEELIDLGNVIAPIKGDFFHNIAKDARRGKKLIVYGTDETAKTLCMKLRVIDIDIDYFVDEDTDEEKTTLCDKKILSVYDLLYEDLNTVMVINTNKDVEHSSKVLTDLGLEECRNFRFIQQYQWNYYRWYHWLDPQLGYNYVNKGFEKYPGFVVYGAGREEDYKIVISGGSTVDATLYPFKPWSEFLYDILTEHGHSVTLYVGGAWGYPVGTEVIKFLRDMLPLRPNLVIDYSGVNDLVIDSNYPFCNEYQKQFYKKISGQSRIRPVTYGVSREEDNFSHWLSCERIMQTVCQEFGIRFLSFLQPMLGSKSTPFSSQEKEIILNSIAVNPSVDYMERGKQFSDSVKEYICKYYWLYDFSHILDEYQDIWIDKCHVNERGNEVIAQKIWEILRLVLNN